MNVAHVSGQDMAFGLTTPESTSDNVAESGQDTFMKLLVAQLEHQDPLSPMKNAEFTAQLAQFSSLEQMQAMQTSLKSLVAAQEAANGVQVANLIGKEVKARSNTLQLHQGEASTLRYTLAADSATVTISIFNNAGNLVQTIDKIDQKAGPQVVTWDGTGAQDDVLPDGEYIFTVTAEDSAGTPVSAETFVQGRVDGVEYYDNKPFLSVEGNRVEPSALIQVLGEGV